MEKAETLPPHDVYFLNADDTSALEPSMELVEKFKPEFLTKVKSLQGHQSFINCDKLKNSCRLATRNFMAAIGMASHNLWLHIIYGFTYFGVNNMATDDIIRIGVVGIGSIAVRGILPHLTQDDVQR